MNDLIIAIAMEVHHRAAIGMLHPTDRWMDFSVLFRSSSDVLAELTGRSFPDLCQSDEDQERPA